MKSTGLFGKNSGRVGGVVYSNYRGEQIVKAYQPKVKNPNTLGQIEQRSKFKLVSQLSVVFSSELIGYKPKNNETPRNAWVAGMLKKTTFNDLTRQAILPIEDIVLTNQGYGIITYDSQAGLRLYGFSSAVRVRDVVVAYNDGGELVVVSKNDLTPQDPQSANKLVSLSTITPIAGLSNYRRIVFAYDYEGNDYQAYEDYVVENDSATLEAVKKYYSSQLVFSESLNLGVTVNV